MLPEISDNFLTPCPFNWGRGGEEGKIPKLIEYTMTFATNCRYKIQLPYASPK